MINLFRNKTSRGTILFLIKLACLSLVIAQTFDNIRNNFFTGKTVTSTRVNKIGDIPLILNIIVKPGFDDKKLCEHGYANVFTYFSGIVAEEGECSREVKDKHHLGMVLRLLQGNKVVSFSIQAIVEKFIISSWQESSH